MAGMAAASTPGGRTMWRPAHTGDGHEAHRDRRPRRHWPRGQRSAHHARGGLGPACADAGGLTRQVLVLAAFRLAFFKPANAACFSDGLALNRTAAPAATSTFSPVRGFSAVHLGVSRTTKEPESG